MSQEFQREYLIRLPLSLAQLYQRAYNDKTAQSRHNNADHGGRPIGRTAEQPEERPADRARIDDGSRHRAGFP